MTEKKLATKWNQLLLEAICLTNTSPPLAARALAMVHTAMFDAWSVYDKTAISTTTAQYIKRPDKECNREHRRKAFQLCGISCADGPVLAGIALRKEIYFSRPDVRMRL